MKMTRKIILLLPIVICFFNVISSGSKSAQVNRVLPNTLTKIYLVGRNFYFKDDLNRRLTLRFENESVMSVQNSPMQYYPNRRFKELYKYKVDDSLNIIIGSLILTDKTNKVFPEYMSANNSVDTTYDYVLPYRRRNYRSQAEVFPNISGDTIFNFTCDKNKSDWAEFIQIGYFVFKGDEEILKDRIKALRKITNIEDLDSILDGF